MTLLTLRTLVSQWVDDPNNGYFTTTTLNLFLNNAQKEVQKRLIMADDTYYTKPVTTTLVANQQDYQIPSDLQNIQRLEVISSGTGVNAERVLLTKITLNQQGLAPQSTGLPSCYYLKKNRVSLLPIPDSTYTMNLYYDYIVTDMVLDADVPDVPEQFQEFVAVLAAFDCFIKDDRIPANIQIKKDAYEKLLKEKAESRDQSSPRMVVQTEDYGGGFF